jgi:nitroimidazol reductase NimA-like FMN-containing flavoprotein (pyridoxamine 5'-phosphate oxidase superfamily)
MTVLALGRIEELTHAESVELLDTVEVGRVVFTAAALPSVVPVCYLRDGDSVLMATSADARLARAATGGLLAFEVDSVDPRTRTGWSVIVMGVAEVVHDPDERNRAGTIPWAEGRDDMLIRIPLSRVTGRRLVRD